MVSSLILSKELYKVKHYELLFARLFVAIEGLMLYPAY